MSKRMKPDPVMKRIAVRAVPFPKEQLADVLKRHDIHINAYAETFFAHPAFRTDRFPEELPVCILPLRELGFSRGATLREIAEALPAFRLKPCPPAAGLFLRMAWKDQEPSRSKVLTGTHQAPDRAVTVFSPLPEQEATFPRGLYLRNADGKLWLRGYVCEDDYGWSGDDLFAFVSEDPAPLP